MRRLAYWSGLLAVLVMAVPAWAAVQDDGTADLEKATELKLDASTLRDLDQVVKLCETALEKGLNEDSTKFAKQLMTGTLFEAAQRLAEPILGPGQTDPRWPFLRQQAVIRLDKALQLEPENGEGHLLRAQLLVLPDGDAAEAKKSLDKAMELFADNPREKSRCQVVAAGLAEDDAGRLAALDEALKLNPENIEALRARGLLHLVAERTAEALADFQRLSEIAPDDRMAQQAIAEVLTNTGKLDEALAAISKAIDASPEVSGNYLIRARVHLMQEKKDEALADLDKAVELDPSEIQGLLMRAEVHMDSEAFDKARMDVERALIVRPGLIRGILLRSLISAGERKFGAAATDLELLVQNDPENIPWKLQLAMMYYADERPSKALGLFEEVLAKDSANYFALRGKADVHLITGDHAGAVAGYSKCLETNAEDDHVLNNLAWVLATSPKDEVRDGKRSVELGLKACEATEYKEAHILSTLAAGYAEIGEWDKAIEFAQKAVDLADDTDNLENLKKEVESYQKKMPWRELQETKDKQPNAGGGSIDL